MIKEREIMPNIKSVIFDLDGTLADTIGDITDAVNYVLTGQGFPLHTPDEYKYFVGDGIRELMVRSLPDEKKTDREFVDSCLITFKNYYDVNYCVHTVPYDGMTDTLKTLKEQGIRLAVVTNKNEEAAKLVTAKLFPGIFEYVIGNSDRIKQKPDPTEVLKIMEHFGVTKTETLYAGDSYTDIETAKNAGVKSIGCLWGFRTYDELKNAGADFIIKNPEEILNCIKGENQ
jgi:phosphoglycolate phosphatase